MQEVREIVKQVIVEVGKYIPPDEISQRSGFSLYTLYKYIPEGLENFMCSLGFEKPIRDTKRICLERISKYLIEQRRAVSAYEVAKVLGISRATLKKYSIDVYELASTIGFNREKVAPKTAGYNRGYSKSNKKKYLPTKNIPSDLELEERCRQLIRESEHYCSTNFLANKLYIAPSLFSYRNISITALNAEEGYVRDNLCFENEVAAAISVIFSGEKIIRQAWFKDCISATGNRLYFDFYIPSKKLLLEADGPCHFDVNHPWYTPQVVDRDARKQKYCDSLNLILVRIPYKHKVTVKYLLQYLSETPLEISRLQRRGEPQP